MNLNRDIVKRHGASNSWIRPTFYCLVLLLVSCRTTTPAESTQLKTPTERVEITSIETSYLGLASSKVTTAGQSSESKLLLRDFESQILVQKPAAKPHLQSAATFLTLSRKMFWIGFGGMIVGQVADANNFIIGRTTGYAVWGLGWAMWIGFLGLTQAEYDDVFQLSFASPEIQGSRVFDHPTLVAKHDLPLGRESLWSGVVITWRAFEF